MTSGLYCPALRCVAVGLGSAPKPKHQDLLDQDLFDLFVLLESEEECCDDDD